MTTLQAHELLATACHYAPFELSSWLPDGSSIEAPDGCDCLPAALTAAAVISGELGDCESLDDLHKAIEHFGSLLAGGVVSVSEWTDEARAVITELLEWGDRVTAYENN